MSSKSKKSSSRPQPLTPARKKAFALITLAIPLLVFGGLEAGLRLFNYGPDLSLFTTEKIGGKVYHVMNQDVKGRYFSHVEFTPNTSADYFQVPKPSGTFRIFCLGGSTTVGFPYGFVGSFSSFLRDRLHAVLPNRNIEIINLGMTATNSFTVNDIARELTGYEPDLFLVYDGHNEFYGALGAASRESIGANRLLTKLYLKCVHLKSFLLLRDGMTKFTGLFSSSKPNSPGGTMMEQLARDKEVPLHSSLYLSCLENFKANLEELKALCVSNNIPLILSTQVSNLRGQPPFISKSDDAPRETEFKKMYELGRKQFDDRHIDSALVLFHQALAIDSERADVHFGIAQCYYQSGRRREANVEFIAARDYDQLRFRTSSDFNDAIHSMEDSSHVAVVDIEGAFRASSPDSLIGNELILEHLHPNLRGYFLMAKSNAAAIRSRHLVATEQEWGKADSVSDDSLWNHRPATQLDELAAQRRIALLTSGWPFRSVTATLPSLQARDTINNIIDQLTKAKMTWEEAHVAAAEYYNRREDFSNAEKEYRALMNQFPLNVSAYLILGQLYLRQHLNEKAEELLQRSLNVEPTLFAYRTLGSIKLNNGKPAEAVSFLEQAYQMSERKEELMQNGYLLGAALEKAGMVDRGVTHLQQLLQRFPNFRQAKDLLNRFTTVQPSK